MCNAIPMTHNFVYLQSNSENLSPQIIRGVAKELLELTRDPPEGIKVYYNDVDITDIQAAIEGPCKNIT